jgi:hypothetical protein
MHPLILKLYAEALVRSNEIAPPLLPALHSSNSVSSTSNTPEDERIPETAAPLPSSSEISLKRELLNIWTHTSPTNSRKL